MIIGLTGGMVSGKRSIAKLLVEKKGFIALTYSSDVLDLELRKRGVPITRMSQQDLGNEIRNSEGSGGLSERLLKKMQKASSESSDSEEKGKNYVLDGIRNPGEIEVLRKEKDFFLIAIDSSQKQRFERIISRGMERDPKTWEEFLKADARDFDDGTLNGLQIAKCMKLADYTIENNGTFEEFWKKFEEVFERIKLQNK